MKNCRNPGPGPSETVAGPRFGGVCPNCCFFGEIYTRCVQPRNSYSRDMPSIGDQIRNHRDFGGSRQGSSPGVSGALRGASPKLISNVSAGLRSLPSTCGKESASPETRCARGRPRGGRDAGGPRTSGFLPGNRLLIKEMTSPVHPRAMLRNLLSAGIAIPDSRR